MYRLVKAVLILFLATSLLTIALTISAEPWPNADPRGPWTPTPPAVRSTIVSGAWTPTPSPAAGNPAQGAAAGGPWTPTPRAMVATPQPAAKTPANVPQSYGVTQGLLLHYTFDQIEDDRVQAATGQSARLLGQFEQGSGILGQGVMLNSAILASESRVQLPAAFTLSAWIRPTHLATNNYVILQAGLTNNPNCDRWQSGAGIALMSLEDEAAETQTLSYQLCDTGIPDNFSKGTRRGVPDDEWIFVTYVYQGAEPNPDGGWYVPPKYYFNGKTQGSAAYRTPTRPRNLTELLRVVGRNYEIDEVKLFGRALSDDEVASEYETVLALEHARRVDTFASTRPDIPKPFQIAERFTFDGPNLLLNATNAANPLIPAADEQTPQFWSMPGVRERSLFIKKGAFTMQKGRLGQSAAPSTLAFWFWHDPSNTQSALSWSTTAYAYSTQYHGCRSNCTPYAVNSESELSINRMGNGRQIGVNFSAGISDYGQAPSVRGASANGQADGWHHLVMTQDKLYLDGRLIMHTTDWADRRVGVEMFWRESAPLVIRATAVRLDEILVFSAELTDNDVIQLYLSQRPN